MSDGDMDRATTERVERGEKPDAIGWFAICDALGITEKTARSWEKLGMPVVNWGPKQVAAYTDRLRAWAARPRRRLAA